jgi:hypothetical protein
MKRHLSRALTTGRSQLFIDHSHRLSKKLHSLPSSIRRIISCVEPSRPAANSVMRRTRRTEPARQRSYVRLNARVDPLEDAIQSSLQCHKQFARARFDAGEEVKD